MKNWGRIVFILGMLIVVLTNVHATCENGFDAEANETCPTINIGLQKTTIEVGEDAIISFSINSENYELSNIKINYGFGNLETITLNSENIYVTQKEYDSEGDYTINITLTTTTGLQISKTKTLHVNEPEIVDEKPTVTLISPSNKYTSKTDTVTFSFKANDDLKLSRCDFEIYSKQGSIKELEYEEGVNNPTIDEEYSISLKEFDDGNYTWYITCKDNSSQEDTENRDLEIKTVLHPREKEILQLLEDIDTFMTNEDKLSLEEKEALDQLGMNEDLKYYKKRLIQINQDLGSNINLISDTTLREKRRVDSLAELDEIKEKIPYKIEVINSEEYIKNTIITNLENITSKYIDAKRIVLDKRKIKKLAKLNLEIQNKLTVSTEIKQIEIEYLNETSDITIVTKQIKLSDNSIRRILENFPASIKQEAEFITKAGKLSSGFYEIDLNELDKDEIKYYFKDKINIDQLKDTDTILFEEFSTDFNGITGLSILPGDIDSNSIWIGLGVLVLFLLVFLGWKFLPEKINSSWKREPNVISTNKYLEEGNKAIDKENIDLAKENYHKIKEIYGLLPEDFKNHAYPKLEKLRIEIDKREMREYIREFENSKREGRKSDANIIYNKIRTKYTHLPKKYQEKVYERVILKSA
ncbi:hypothetical protein GW932_04325 [archaeon]|nr:hypothetical protein [archaeon]